MADKQPTIAECIEAVQCASIDIQCQPQVGYMAPRQRIACLRRVLELLRELEAGTLQAVQQPSVCVHEFNPPHWYDLRRCCILCGAAE